MRASNSRRANRTSGALAGSKEDVGDVAGVEICNQCDVGYVLGDDYIDAINEIEWEKLDGSKFPFMHRIADGLNKHDDRAQFLAGIDLILAGIQSIR